MVDLLLCALSAQLVRDLFIAVKIDKLAVKQRQGSPWVIAVADRLFAGRDFEKLLGIRNKDDNSGALFRNLLIFFRGSLNSLTLLRCNITGR